ncbi:MAG: arylesterase [Oligoflexus sp.]
MLVKTQFGWKLCLITFCLMLFGAPNILAKPKILALGDSLTFGYEVAAEKTWPALLQKKLKDAGHPEAEVLNAGTSGATTAFGQQTLRFHLRRHKPDLLIYGLGANDGLRGHEPASIEKNIRETIQYAQKQNMKVLLLGMKAPPNYGSEFPEEFEKLFQRIAKDLKIEFLPFYLDGVAGKPELNQPDGIHPNEKGYEIIATNIFNKVKTIL